MKKPKNTDSSLDFDFMDGSDDFFPLELDSGKGGTEKPKGVKGYFKNVAKSVKNLGAKTGKSLLPELYDFKDQFADLNEGSPTIDIKAIINKYKRKASNVRDEANAVAKSIYEDTKTAVKTGYFFKSEDESMSMGSAFGDMFGDSDVSFDNDGSVDFGSTDFDISDDASRVSSKGHISSSEATIRSSAASTKALLKSGNRQVSTIVGATQAHIHHETELFARQLEITQEQHRQKMRVMKNIATNVAKSIQQNNISIKAQMEYSAKSLAFAQDTAALLKEVRDAQWKLIKPIVEAEQKEQETEHKKIFGFGGRANLGAWKKYALKNIKSNAGGGIFEMLGMLKDSIGMMEDFGMSRADAIKQFGGGMLFDTLLGGMKSRDTTMKLDTLNKKIAGIPAALNKKLGKISRGNSTLNSRDAKINPIMKLFGSNPITEFLVGQLENVAANAYVRDDVKYRSDRYKMGDPDKVHPFDNKAHKVLTEVIPAYLGKISAGVNHTEEEVFDFKQNAFVPARVFRNRIKQAREEVLHRTEGYSTFKTNFEDLSGKYGENLKGDGDKIRSVIKKFADSAESETSFKKTKYTNEDGSLNTAAMSKIIPTMMENYLKYGLSFDVDRELRDVKFKYENGEYVEGRYSGVILNGTDLKTTYERKAACDLFFSAIRKMRPNSRSSSDEKDLWTNLVVASNSYTSRLSDANMEIEERNSKYGNSIIHDSFTATEEIDRQLRNEIDAIERRQKQLKNIEYDENGKPKANITDLSKLRNASRKVADSKERVLDLKMRRGEFSSRINDGLDNVDNKYMMLSGGKLVENEDVNFNNYRISSLEDSSTHGLVQNIYNLLLSGIDVYTTPKENMPDERRAFIRKTKGRLAEKSVQKMQQKTERDELSTYIRCTKPYPSDPSNIQDWFRENYIDVDYTGYLWYKVNSDWEKDRVSSAVGGREYYLSISEKEAYDIRKRKETDREIASYSGSVLSRMPIIGKFYNMFNSVVGGASGVANDVLGNTLYDEANSFKKFNRQNAEDFIKSIPDNAKNFFGDLKSDATGLRDKAKNQAGNLKNKAGELASTVGGKLSDAKNKIKDETLKKLDELEKAINSEKNQEKRNKLIKQLSELRDKAKNQGIFFVDSVKKKFDSIKVTVSRLVDENENTEFFDALKKGNFKGAGLALIAKAKKRAEKSIVEPLMRRELTGRLMSLKIGQKTLAMALSSIKDVAFHKELRETKDPMAKASLILQYANKTPELAEFTGLIEAFIKEQQSNPKTFAGAMGMLISRVKKRGEERLRKIGNRILGKIMGGGLDRKLFALKVDDKTLGETIGKLNDQVINKALEECPTAIDKAKYLLDVEAKEIEPYKSLIREFISEYDGKDNVGIVATTAGKIVDKAVNKIMDIVENLLLGGDKRKSKKLVPKDMLKLEGANGQIFGDIIFDVIDKNGLIYYLEPLKGDPVKVASFFIDQDIEEIKPFIKVLRDYIKEQKDGGSKNKNGLFGGLKAAANIFSKYNISSLALKESEEEKHSEGKSLKDAAKSMTSKFGKKLGGAAGAIATVATSLKGKISGLKKGDGAVNGDSADEQKRNKLESQRLKREEENSKSLKDMAASLKDMKKDGIGLNKDAKKAITDANELGSVKSEMKNGEGVLNTVEGFIDKMGLSNTRAGAALKKGAGAVKGILGQAKGIFNSVGKGGSAGVEAGKMLGKTLGNIVGGPMGGMIGEAVGGAVGGGIGVNIGAGKGIISAALGIVKKIVEALCKGIKGGVGSVAQKIVQGIGKGITKFAPKLGPKLVTLSARSATIILEIAALAVGYGKGLTKAKEYLGVGKGMRITTGMRMACGFADALDTGLVGIPGLIAKLFGQKNAASWFYSLIGSDVEKAELARYLRYNEKRARIFGIDKPDMLVAYENRSEGEGVGGTIKNVANKVGRAALNFVTFGAALNNDEKDASMLGFKSVKVFKYWKTNKYKPLDDLRKTVAEKYGGLKVVEEFVKVDPNEVDEDGDGEIDENQESQEQMQKLELQQKYRVDYLETARKWVLDNNLAWLTSHCTDAQFKKYSGQDAGEHIEINMGKRAKEGFIKRTKTALTVAATALTGPIGGAIVATKLFGKDIKEGFKNSIVGKWFEGIMKKYNMDNTSQDAMKAANQLIVGINKNNDPDFYGDGRAAEVKPDTSGPSENNSGEVVNVGENGGVESTGEGYYVRVEKDKNSKLDRNPDAKSGKFLSDIKQQMQQATENAIASSERGRLQNFGNSDTFDMSGRTPKAIVKNSIINDFVKDFGGKVTEKLNILEEIHKESLRHNKVSEEFFVAALAMLNMIAKNSGNTETSSKLDDMIKSITRS